MPHSENAGASPGRGALFPARSVPLQARLETRTWRLGTALWLQGLRFGCGPSFVIGLASAASAPARGRCQLLPPLPGLQMAPPAPGSSPSHRPLLPPVLPNHLYSTPFSTRCPVTTRSTLCTFPIPELGGKKYSRNRIILSYKPQRKSD